MASETSWTNLPDIALTKIYYFSYDSDRLNMACTCKNWKRMFHSPILWRERRVVFKGVFAEKTADLECKFLRKYGQHLIKLSLCFGAPTFRTCRIISKASEQYLTALALRRDIQIRELDIEHLHMEQNWHYVLSRNRLVSALCKMIRRQRFLDAVFCSGARMTLFDGCRLLEALSKGCNGRTIQTLFIEDMFETHIFPYRNQRFISVMSNFMSLVNLHINYKYLNAETLGLIGRRLSRTLLDLSLIFEGDTRGVELSSDAWVDFVNACPNVNVGAYLCTTIFRGPLSNPFVPGMPLTECYVTSWSRINNTEDRIHSFLYHLGDTYSRSLGAVALHFENHEPFDEALIYMLGKCRHIHELCVCADLTADTILQICRLHSEGKVAFKNINLTVNGLSHVEWQFIHQSTATLLADILPNVDIRAGDYSSSLTSTLTMSTESEMEENQVSDENEEVLLPDDGEVFLI